MDTPSRLSEAQTQTSPENTVSAAKSNFIQNNVKDERTITRAHRRCEITRTPKARTKRIISPINSNQSSPHRSIGTISREKVKEAISPSLAECIRAVFAAFLWHEGIVYDAMACASFLKFHPGLPKQGALVVTRQNSGQSSGDAGNPQQNQASDDSQLKKELRARQRHSVEVTTNNDGDYLRIQPSTLETLTRSAANASRARNKTRSDSTPATKDQDQQLNAFPEHNPVVAILPPALKSLVFLWEELSRTCLQSIDQLQVRFSIFHKFYNCFYCQI